MKIRGMNKTATLFNTDAYMSATLEKYCTYLEDSATLETEKFEITLKLPYE